ncbi:MAG TPA: class I SAM-dependent methyltransferase [Ferruginibacter sp.]|jgi:SAM-dependent methyltransferase|nr:class I SAM-dependent methyltransferase [Ferruginibacter sp.]
MDTNYQKVIEANIALHSKMSDDYSTCEPHFRPENIASVEGRMQPIFEETKAKRMLDLGCGTGFVINIAKKYVGEIHGVDVTRAMMDKVDLSGDAKIELYEHDTGSFPAEAGSYDMVTAYSFLHHLYDVVPTLKTAYNALRDGGIFYADLDPNYYFWEGVNKLDRNGEYDGIVKREIEMVTYKDEDIEKNFGVDKDVFNSAEYGKNIKGGFKAEELEASLKQIGFKKVTFFYHWFIGQGQLINDEHFTKEERFRYAEISNLYLQKALPLSRNLFKYIGFTAQK